MNQERAAGSRRSGRDRSDGPGCRCAARGARARGHRGAATRKREARARRTPRPLSATRPRATTAMERAVGAPPQLTILERPASADLQQEKQWLTEPVCRRWPPSSRAHRRPARRRRGRRRAAPSTGRYELFVPENIDDRIETELYDAIRESLVAARIRAHNLNRAEVEAVMTGSARGVGHRGGRRRAPDQRRVQSLRCRSCSRGCWSSAS